PAAASFVAAACLPPAYLTAYRMLFPKARLQPGQSVLVQGAGGGVGTAAIVLARAAGLTVFAASRSLDKRTRAMELGAVLAVEPGGRLPDRGDAVVETVGRAPWGPSPRSPNPGGAVARA